MRILNKIGEPSVGVRRTHFPAYGFSDSAFITYFHGGYREIYNKKSKRFHVYKEIGV